MQQHGNRQRFRSANPISYGPEDQPAGGPAGDEDRSGITTVRLHVFPLGQQIRECRVAKQDEDLLVETIEEPGQAAMTKTNQW